MKSTVTLQTPHQFFTEPLSLGIRAATSDLLQRVVGQVAWLIQQCAQHLLGELETMFAGQIEGSAQSCK
jgi:hypothetical protein